MLGMELQSKWNDGNMRVEVPCQYVGGLAHSGKKDGLESEYLCVEWSEGQECQVWERNEFHAFIEGYVSLSELHLSQIAFL